LKILVRTPNWIGDHVMAHPFYFALKRAYPDSEIHFLCSESLGSFNDPLFCQKKTVLTSKAKRAEKEFFQLAKRLENESYDLAISLVASFSSSLLLYLARIPLRVGFSQSGSGLFLTDSLKWKGMASKKHKSEIYLDLLNFITGKDWKSDLPEVEKSREIKKRIVVAPGASISLRVWPYFKKLLQCLSESYPEHEILVVGAKAESSWHEVIEQLKLKNIQDWIERTNISEMIALCADSQLVIANDSGVGHLSGTLAKAPTVVLFGPGNPDYIRPLGPDVYCETPLEVPCHPCEKPYCHEKYGYQACLKSISLERVLGQASRLIPR